MTRYRDPPVRYPFSRLVRICMDERAWSAATLAREARVGAGTVRRVLAGHDVMLSSALKIAAALSLPAGRLGQAADIATARDPERRAAHYRQLAGMADGTGTHAVRCWECALCDKPGALVCNEPPGICHPGECEMDG